MKPESAKGVLIAAASSGAGKTTFTLALLRALGNAGLSVTSAKSGPDYIDPKFHEAASGAPCINLDAWAMPADLIRSAAARQALGADLMVVEGAMGLFDGAANGQGSAADLAAILDLPVIFVIDCAKQAQSVAALVSGFMSFRRDVTIAGVILNRVGSPRHEAMLRKALAPLPTRVLGAVPRLDSLLLPERHLGLVQATEHQELERFLDAAANVLDGCVDLEAVIDSGSSLRSTALRSPAGILPPLGQRIAVASDVAFAFTYPHLLKDWRSAGAELSFFSPLAEETPDPSADAIYLPGGYPELHAGSLAAATTFKTAMASAASRSTLIYGECGGYMALGEALIDGDGQAHEMLGLLPLETSFATRKRCLGYRRVVTRQDLPWAGPLSAHEFHYATIVRQGHASPLFDAVDAEGNELDAMGMRAGSVMGSFAHVICRAP